MLILASKSPRRREFMELITTEFIVKTSDIDESLPNGIAPKDAVIYLSKLKANDVFDGENCVIGADTVVAVDDEILGKPKDEEDARRMLNLLSNREHDVFTGINIICPGDNISFYSQTKVTFYDIGSLIDDYLKSKEPYDKAGAYGIQGKAALFVKKIDGDYFNVVGLPVAKLYRALQSIDII